MDIRNVTEFRNFVNNNQLRTLHSAIDAVCICVMDYEKGCGCWNNNDRQRIYENCKILYQQAIGVISNTYKSHFMAHVIEQQLNFYMDGRIIGSIRR